MEYIEAYPIPGFREPVNCFSHLAAIPLFVILGCYLVRQGRGSRGRTASLAIMAVSSVFLLAMSSVYHLLGPGTARNVMKQLDVAGVFTLIAGTATPIHVILFRGFNRWVPLLVAWSIAVTGIILRSVFSGLLVSEIGMAVFLLLGWGGLFSCVHLWRRYGFKFIKPLLLGGVAYTLGAIVLVLNWPILIRGVVGAHELWHVAVLVGLGQHWAFVFQFAGGPPDADAASDGSEVCRLPESN